MPIHIYNTRTGERITSLCPQEWELPTQIDKLEQWLTEEGINLVKDEYKADVGFDIRREREGIGGGSVLSVEAMKIMSDIGFELWLSEYPA